MFFVVFIGSNTQEGKNISFFSLSMNWAVSSRSTLRFTLVACHSSVSLIL